MPVSRPAMKILLAHNYYGSAAPSGENQVFDAERALLRSRGHVIDEYVRHSDEIRNWGMAGAICGALATPWNPWSARAARVRTRKFVPDVVHVHNTFPLLSPSIFHAVGKHAARVLTLHNYRLFCPAAIPMREGSVCTECLDRRSVLPALKHGCYRGSRLATVPLAANVALHRWLGTWRHHVDAFIALSEFQKERMVEAGLPVGQVHVKPNFFEGNPQPVPWVLRDNVVVFAGRLSEEKGVEHLVHAWLAWGETAPELRILGDGPLRERLVSLVECRGNKRIHFMGQITASDTARQIAHARLLVLPSIWFEGFPMVIREAFAFGTPVAVSDIGPLPSIVRSGISGLIFAPANPDSLLHAIKSSWGSGSLEQLGQGARAEFEAHYNENVNYECLMDIYARAEFHKRSRP